MADKDYTKAYPDRPADYSTADDGEEEIGYIELADDVIAIVASLAALDVPGVISMSTGFREGLSNFLGKKSLAKGVRVKVTGHSCRVAVYVTVEYGCNIPEVAMKLQKKVKSAVDEMTEYTAEYVDVHIEGVKRREKSELEISFNSPEDGRTDSIF
ncbi:MAG: Asp23/Gls24 family envelope stress response protein [Acidaminococcaceae bacterium]|nr:Asp23/Gls24 family envelope stress response protein [Acidaminococcaceae bacterium]